MTVLKGIFGKSEIMYVYYCCTHVLVAPYKHFIWKYPKCRSEREITEFGKSENTPCKLSVASMIGASESTTRIWHNDANWDPSDRYYGT
jgi:hypothetical protein